MAVIQEFGIASKIGYFVMDNATNNDTLVTSLSASKSAIIIVIFIVISINRK